MTDFYITKEDIIHNHNGYWFTDELENAIWGPFQTERDAILAEAAYHADIDEMLHEYNFQCLKPPHLRRR